MGRYAIKTPPMHTTWDAMLAVWREADSIELFESAWTWDHLYPLRGDVRGPSLEGWLTLTALAQATERIGVGCMVTGMHFRHPSITAKMAATLDIISGGRSYLGLGAGWLESEAEAHGIELGSVGERMDRFDEGLEVIVSLLTNDTTNYTGDYYRLTEAILEPKPVQRPHPPIMIGGTGRRRTLRNVARYAQLWDSLRASPEEWADLKEVLAEHCAAVGRDPTEIRCSVHITYSRGDDPLRLADEAAARLADGVDFVVFSMADGYEAPMVESLAASLTSVA